MQALEDQENAISVLRLDPDSVIGDGKHPERPFAASRDGNARRLLALELQRVAQQVLEDHAQERGLRPDHRQRRGLNHGAGLVDPVGQVRLRRGERRLA